MANRAQPRSAPAGGARRALGNTGEDLAAAHLRAAGLSVLERNWRPPSALLAGEIDIIAEDNAPDLTRGGEVVPWRVIVEVRTRRGSVFGTALQSVGPRKQEQLRRLGQAWVQEHAWAGPWRIDVVAVQMDGAGRLLSVEHLRGAVAGG